jgi:hypothetical protein
LNVASRADEIAVVTKTRSPQITGLECASPGIGVLQAMPRPSAADHVSGRWAPSATPEALGPRNCGQWVVAATTAAARSRRIAVL